MWSLLSPAHLYPLERNGLILSMEISPDVYNSLEPLWVCLQNKKGCFLLARETSVGGGVGVQKCVPRYHRTLQQEDHWATRTALTRQGPMRDSSGNTLISRTWTQWFLEAKPGAPWYTHCYTQRDSIDSWWSREWILEFSLNLVFFMVSVKKNTPLLGSSAEILKLD